MKKGDSIYKFLQKCLEALRKDFNELRLIEIQNVKYNNHYILCRVASVDNLMYVKEDLIIPQVIWSCVLYSGKVWQIILDSPN